MRRERDSASVRARVLLGLLLAALASGPPAAFAQDPATPARGAEVTLLTDPRGDAQEAGATSALDTVCASLCPPPDELAPLGAPAPPVLDVLAVHARVDPDHLILALEVASVDEALTGMVVDGRGSYLDACWDRAVEGCEEGARFYARASPDVGMHIGANYGFRDETCNTLAQCGWGVEHRLVTGSPGRIEILIPRALLPFPMEQGAAITNVQVRSVRLLEPLVELAPDQAPPIANSDRSTTVDVASGSEAFILDLPRAPSLAPSGAPWGLGPGLSTGTGATSEAEADILEVRLVETPTSLTFSHKLAFVSDAPQDQVLRTEWALFGGRYHIVRVFAVERQREISSLACSAGETPGCANTEEVPAVFEVTTGAPGFINITYLREDIGAPPAEVHTTRIVSFTAYGVRGGSGVVTDADLTGLLPPFVLRFATRQDLPPQGAVRIDDATGDARIPPVGDAAPDASAFEVTHVEAQALAGGYLRLAMGLRDPSSVALPAGYAGALRAVAIEEAGRVTMAGAYATASGERYFCTVDTAVLAASRTMPPEGSWRELSATRSPEAPGNITFFVPPECLASPDTTGARRGQRLGAASFLVRETPGGPPELALVDEAVGVEAFDLVLVSTAPAPIVPTVARSTPWWLWLVVAGAVVVVGGSGVAALLLRRERAPALPAPGALFLQKYLVDREIGRGGFGAVWLATHVKLDRKVVIKQLHPGWASDPAAAERFRREARVLAKLDHPHITRVYDAEEVAGLAFIVMEYVEGGTLGDLRPKPASSGIVGRLGAQLLDALDAIHEAGIVHGDLKPDNVLLAADGGVRVADFGIARPTEAAGSSAPRTMGYQQEANLGTPLFMAPEQLSGAPASAKSDLYAAAAVVHHIATGRLLFTPAPVDVISARLAHERTAPDVGEGVLHPALVAWLRRGLARDPGDRYADARVMREALIEAVALAKRA